MSGKKSNSKKGKSKVDDLADLQFMQCDECFYSTVSEEDMAQHKSKCHVCSCHICGAVFKSGGKRVQTIRNLKNHVATVHGGSTSKSAKKPVFPHKRDFLENEDENDSSHIMLPPAKKKKSNDGVQLRGDAPLRSSDHSNVIKDPSVDPESVVSGVPVVPAMVFPIDPIYANLFQMMANFFFAAAGGDVVEPIPTSSSFANIVASVANLASVHTNAVQSTNNPSAVLKTSISESPVKGNFLQKKNVLKTGLSVSLTPLERSPNVHHFLSSQHIQGSMDVTTSVSNSGDDVIYERPCPASKKKRKQPRTITPEKSTPNQIVQPPTKLVVPRKIPKAVVQSTGGVHRVGFERLLLTGKRSVRRNELRFEAFRRAVAARMLASQRLHLSRRQGYKNMVAHSFILPGKFLFSSI